jgi:hypothetical protein
MMIFLSACVTPGGERITDFSNRSVIYGWLDIKDVDANRLHNVTLYQYYPKTNLPYFNVKVVEFEEGYLYYAFSFEQGSYGLDSVAGQQCFGLCGNTIYTYTFGRQGDEVGKVRINEPGVYNIGTFKLTEIDTGLFEQSKFDILPASNVPSEYSMLEAMLPDAKDKPQIDALLRAAMQKHEI